jgi:hypothetical protein
MPGGALLALAACGDPNACAGISRHDAVVMAKRAKADMLSRSIATYAANFGSDEATQVLLDDGGYAAKVAFKGRDGWSLIALIDTDCYLGWTKRGPNGELTPDDQAGSSGH